MQIVPIVEGHGDVQAVPILLRRIAEQRGAYALEAARPIRCPRYKIVKEHELERVVRLAAVQSDPPAAILILLDAETDCPAELGPSLLARARATVPDLPVAVVLAKNEYEAWFLASVETLRGRRGIRKDASPPPDPEEIRGAKESLEDLLEPGRTYSETVDQPALTALMDLHVTRQRSPSFDKLWRETERLIDSIAQAGSTEPST